MIASYCICICPFVRPLCSLPPCDQNLERKQARAASGEKPPAVQWVHKTSKHQAVTEPRGTIINEMRVLRQGPELLRRETQVEYVLVLQFI